MGTPPYNLGKYYLLVEFVLIIFLPLFLPRLVLNSSKAMAMAMAMAIAIAMAAMAMTLLVIGAATYLLLLQQQLLLQLLLLSGSEVLFFDLYCFFLKPKRD